MMRRVLAQPLLALAACVGVLVAGPSAAATDRFGNAVGKALAAHVSASGQTVRDADGQRKNYSREQWRVAPAAAKTQAAGFDATAATGREASWAYAAFGSGIGSSGIAAAPRGGATEVYVGGSSGSFGSNTRWQALRFGAAGAEPQQVFVSPDMPSPIVRIALARTAAAADDRIVIALEDGTLLQYDQSSKRLLSNAPGSCASRGGLTAFTTADLDGNGSDEFIAACGNQTLTVDGKGYSSWTLAGVGGADLIAAQMDGDTALEIASTSGKIVDAGTRTVQWNRSQGFGAQLQVADFDNDGMQELIAADAWYIIWAYDVDRQLPKWSLSIDLDIGAIRVGDIDGDGIQELMVGEGQWGSVLAYDMVTLAQKGAIGNPEHGVTNIAVADLDGNGSAELLWGAGATSTGPDHLYIANWATKNIVWQNEDLVGPFVGPAAGDLDGDGKPEIVFASTASDADYGSGRIIVLDGKTLAVRGISPGVVGNSSWTGLRDLQLRDINGDGRLEILIAADYLYDGAIEAYSFSANDRFSMVWTNATRPEGASFYSVDAVDLNGDGQVEIVAGAGRQHTGADGVYIYAFDVPSRKELRHTLQMGEYWSAVTRLATGDFDGDGLVEVAGMVGNDDVYVFDGASFALEAIIDTQASTLTGLAAADGPRLVVGESTGRIATHAFDGVGYPEVAAVSVSSAAIDGITVASPAARWVGTNGNLRRYKRERLTYETANYGTDFGRTVLIHPNRPLVMSGGGNGVFGFDAR
jgi:FG-GAP-like repeat